MCSSDLSGVVAPALLGTGDPSIHGGALTIYNGAGKGGKVVIDLPASAWLRSGTTDAPTYKFASSTGPISSIVLRNGLLQIKGKGAGLLPLANAPQGWVAMRLRTGFTRPLCANAQAASPTVDTTSRFDSVKAAPIPATCPAIP